MSQELPTNLIVNYIPREFTDELLQKLFSQFGEIESARIIRDKLTNETKGYGFVKYISGESAAKAIEALNGFEILGKRLKLSYSHHNKAPIPVAGLENKAVITPPATPQQTSQPVLFMLPRPLSPQLQFAAPLTPTSVDGDKSHSDTPAPLSPSHATISPRHVPISPMLSPACVPLMVSPQLLFPNQMAQMTQFAQLQAAGALDPRLLQFGAVPVVSLSALNMM